MKSRNVDDVMTTTVIGVHESAPYRELVDLLVRHRVSAVPVVDAAHRVIGVVSEADLLRKIEYAGDEEPRLFDRRRRRRDRTTAAGRTAADLMSRPPVVALRGTTIAAAARLMDAERVKRLPVVDDLGRLLGIVSRADLLKVHLRADEEVLADLMENVLQLFLADGSSKVIAAVVDGVVTLDGHVDRWSSADLVVRLTRQVPGVVDVTSHLVYDFDDSKILYSGSMFGAEP